MIINTEVNKTTTSSNIKGSAMAVNITSTSFNFILDNLYTQPHRAIVRELSCNAWDAHVQAGNKVPFHIQVPSKFNQTFIIRDFGVGLTPDEIDLYLNTLYQSSKGSSNEQIGGFGLGAKSPFALVQSFFISSYKDNIEYKCFWFRDSEGIPILKIQSQAPTEEPNGIKYIINFEGKDIDSIVKACSSELLGLEIKPRFFSDINDPATEFDIIGQSGIEIVNETSDYLLLRDSGRILSDTFLSSSAYRRTSLRLLMSIGGVLYPTPPSFDVKDVLIDVQNFLQIFDTSLYIVIKFPIGAIKLPSTREHILDTPENISIIKEGAVRGLQSFLVHAREDYLASIEDKDICKMETHLEALPSYCKNSGISYEGATSSLIKDDVILSDTFINVFSKAAPEVLSQTTASYALRENVNNILIDASNKKINRPTNIFLLKKIDPLSYRTSSSQYEIIKRVSDICFSKRTEKVLIVFNDGNRFMSSYLSGVEDINSYKYIYKCYLNPAITSSVDLSDLYLLLKEYIKGYNNPIITLIKNSDLSKPVTPVGTSPTVASTTLQSIRRSTIDRVNGSYSYDGVPFKKLINSSGKVVPFGVDYIKESGIIGYVVKDKFNQYIDYYTTIYYRSLGIKVVYFVKGSQEAALIAGLKTMPDVTKIVKIQHNLLKGQVTFDHINPELLQQFSNCAQILTGIDNSPLRTSLFKSYYNKGSFNLLNDKLFDRWIADDFVPNNINMLIPDADINALVSRYSSKVITQYSTSGLIDTPFECFSDKELLGILSQSIQPIMFQLVERILNTKEINT